MGNGKKIARWLRAISFLEAVKTLAQTSNNEVTD